MNPTVLSEIFNECKACGILVNLDDSYCHTVKYIKNTTLISTFIGYIETHNKISDIMSDIIEEGSATISWNFLENSMYKYDRNKYTINIGTIIRDIFLTKGYVVKLDTNKITTVITSQNLPVNFVANWKNKYSDNISNSSIDNSEDTIEVL